VTTNEVLILIPALTAAVVSVIHALQDRDRERKLDKNTALTAQTQDTTSQIKTLVNGQSEALKRALDTAQAHILALEAENARLKGQS
jgi:hypothetical protein